MLSWEDFCSADTLIKRGERWAAPLWTFTLPYVTRDTAISHNTHCTLPSNRFLSTGNNTGSELRWQDRSWRLGAGECWAFWMWWRRRRCTLKELCTRVSSRSMTTQIFPWSWALTAGRRQSSRCWQNKTNTHLSTGASIAYYTGMLHFPRAAPSWHSF